MKTNNLGDILAAIPQPNRNPVGVRTWLDARDLERRAEEFGATIRELCEAVGRLAEGERRSRLGREVEQVKELCRRLARVESLADECDRIAGEWRDFALVGIDGDDNRSTLEQLAVARDRRQDAGDLRAVYAQPMRVGIEALIGHVRGELAAAPKLETVTEDAGDFMPKTASQRRAGRGVAVS